MIAARTTLRSSAFLDHPDTGSRDPSASDMTRPLLLSGPRTRKGSREAGRFCCQVRPRPRRRVRTRRTSFETARPLTRRGVPPHSCRSQLSCRPGNGGTMPGEKPRLYHARRSWFAPADSRADAAGKRFGGGAGYCPRVRYAYSTSVVYRHSRLIPTPHNIARSGRPVQDHGAARTGRAARLRCFHAPAVRVPMGQGRRADAAVP